jgi:hypothetical protein
VPEIKVETAKPNGSAPPRRDTRPTAPVTAKGIHAERIDAVDGVFQLVGMGLVMGGQFADAGAIDMHGHNVSIEVAELAGKNEGVAKVVDTLLTVGPYAGLVIAVMPMVLQLMVNHKVIPVEKMPPTSGIVDPKSLEAQVKTAMAKQAIEALQAQREAEEELASMRQQFEDEMAHRAPAEDGS